MGRKKIDCRLAANTPGDDRTVATRIRQDGSPRLPTLELELADDGACLAACGVSRKRMLWPPQSAFRIVDKWSAARWCLDLLRTRADLRRRFPHALSEGLAVGFAQWLLSNEANGLGAPAGLAHTLEAMFSTDLSERARQAFMFKSDVRSALPHGLTPAGRSERLLPVSSNWAPSAGSCAKATHP